MSTRLILAGLLLSVPLLAACGAKPEGDTTASANVSEDGAAPAATVTELTVRDPQVREVLEGATVTAAFFTLVSPTQDALLAVNSPNGGRCEIHETVMEDGVMKMSQVDRVDTPANTEVAFKRGGLHIMIFDAPAMAAGGDLPLELVFESGAKQLVTFKVVSGRPGNAGN